MTQQIKKKLNDSWGMRWGALAIVAFTMMGGVCVGVPWLLWLSQ